MFSIGEFKGNAVISLKRSEDDKYGFTFGLSKAKMVLEHIDDIKKFVEDTEKEKAKVKEPEEA